MTGRTGVGGPWLTAMGTLCVALFLGQVPVAEAQTAAGVTGVARDTTGAVLPGGDG